MTLFPSASFRKRPWILWRKCLPLEENSLFLWRSSHDIHACGDVSETIKRKAAIRQICKQ